MFAVLFIAMAIAFGVGLVGVAVFQNALNGIEED
jgi:hypothetical protein